MEALNLKHHTADQFTGKSIVIHGRNYRIGARFRESDQGYAHFLFNELSGLCLNIGQIRREYRSNPVGALRASQEKAKQTASLRSDFRMKGEAVDIPFISVIEGNGGSFEVHEIAWGAF